MPTTFAADQILTVGQLNAALVQATNDAVARQTPISPAMAGVVGLPTVIQAWNVLSASGIITQTPQVAFGPVGNAFPTFGCIVQQTTTISQNVREFALAVGLESNIGHGGITGGIRADKVAIYGGIEGFANSADIWAINTVTRLVSGFPSDSNALGYELDFNNNASNRGTGIGTAGLGFPFASGLVITGGGGSAGAPLSATSGLHIGGGAATGNGFSGTWERGIVIDTAVQAAIFDWSHATTAFVSYGTHSFGIDLAPMGLFNGGHAIRLANSQDLASNNADNSATVPLIYLDGNNNVTIGGGGSRIFYNAQNMVPFSDNLCNLGGGTLRFSTVFSVNGTIQTSDPRLKTDITRLPSALAIIGAIDPVSFKWIEGGQDSVEVTERQMVHATEPQHEVTTEIQIIDGRAVQVEKTITHTAHLYDTLPVHDADGNPVMVEVPARFQDPNNPVSQVQKMHRVERMVEADVKVIKTIPRPGKRTHLGFLATDLRDAFAQHWPGMDPGAYVQTEDGTHHSRPDQLIPILWKGLREALLRIESLEAKVEGMESGRTVAPSA